MAIKRYDYFYDQQITRFLMQVVRALSGFQYMTGQRGDIAPSLQLVPCKMAARNRQAAIIQKNASDNTLLSVPQISVDMTNFEFDRERLQNINHVEYVQATEREVDPITGQYSDRRGNSVTIERLMPRPFVMTVQVDVWTSTLDQKYQLMEQICSMFAPSFDIQNSDNALDWSAITTATFESMQWTSISIPIGAGGENQIDIGTITLKIPMWLSPPAKIHRQTLIHQVITNITEAERNDEGVIIAGDDLETVMTTPNNHAIVLSRGSITLLGPSASPVDLNDQPYDWYNLFDQYNETLRPAETKIILRADPDDDTRDIVGTIQPTGSPNVLNWHPDVMTLPQNTLAAVNAIINPLVSHPLDDNLPAAQQGQRYLLKGDLASPSVAWGSVIARDGSIIEYQNGAWVVVFDPAQNTATQYVVNSMSGSQLKWDIEEHTWVMALDGIYHAGYWRIGFV